ncbi:MAG: peroxiredoxin [Alphaproteobacteria bacterium]|nr:peroxiredoxin [Alphaproteobacteria bacterium]
MTKDLNVGDKAPAFSLATDGGERVSLKDLTGKPIVLYFYPKDDTSGCTREAVAFTALLPKFSRLGVAVIGVSKDSVESHAKFKAKHELGVVLGSDPDGKVVQSYGCWVEKSLYGRKYMGIDRSTFLIDPKGKISRIWRKVKVPGHAEEVLAAAKAMANPS